MHLELIYIENLAASQNSMDSIATPGANLTVSDAMLYRIGKSVPLTAADFRNFAAHRVINAAEAAEILGCSRQNIIDLTKRGKLHPIKASEKSTLYLKSEILKRNWQ